MASPLIERDPPEAWYVRGGRYPRNVAVALLGPEVELARQRLPTSLIGAALLFGSRARGDYTGDSDVDLLIVCSDGAPPRSTQALKSLGSLGVRAVIHTWPTLRSLVRSDWLFTYHLRNEGKPLWDPEGQLMDVLRPVIPSEAEIRGQIFAHHADLDRYSDLERWSNDTLFPFAHLFRVTKRVCMLANARHGEFVFNRRQRLSRAHCYSPMPQSLSGAFQVWSLGISRLWVVAQLTRDAAREIARV